MNGRVLVVGWSTSESAVCNLGKARGASVISDLNADSAFKGGKLATEFNEGIEVMADV